MARGNGLHCITSSQRMASGEELGDMKLKSTKYLDLHPQTKHQEICYLIAISGIRDSRHHNKAINNQTQGRAKENLG